MNEALLFSPLAPAPIESNISPAIIILFLLLENILLLLLCAVNIRKREKALAVLLYIPFIIELSNVEACYGKVFRVCCSFYF